MFGEIIGLVGFYGSTVIVGAVGMITLKSVFFTVEQQTVRMVKRFGKFRRVAHSGLNLKLPFIDQSSKPLSLRTQQHNVKVETITKDKVSVHLTISVQYEVIPDKSFDAFYKLTNCTSQIEAFVFDAVRAKVPEMDLDQVFQNKDEIASAVLKELTSDMQVFGFRILKSLVTEIEPDGKVKEAMNRINAAQRERTAAENEGEAKKVLVIKAAEAEKERKKLQGEGVAAEREAIAQGIAGSADIIRKSLGQGIDPQHVMDVLLTTQGYDALRDIGGSAKATVVFLPNNASDLTKLVAGNGIAPVLSKSA